MNLRRTGIIVPRIDDVTPRLLCPSLYFPERYQKVGLNNGHFDHQPRVEIDR